MVQSRVVNPELSQKDVHEEVNSVRSPRGGECLHDLGVGMTDSECWSLDKLDMVPTAEEAGGTSITDFIWSIKVHTGVTHYTVVESKQVRRRAAIWRMGGFLELGIESK